ERVGLETRNGCGQRSRQRRLTRAGEYLAESRSRTRRARRGVDQDTKGNVLAKNETPGLESLDVVIALYEVKIDACGEGVLRARPLKRRLDLSAPLGRILRVEAIAAKGANAADVHLRAEGIVGLQNEMRTAVGNSGDACERRRQSRSVAQSNGLAVN